MSYTLIFEDHKNIWIFQKAVQSTIAMVESGAKNTKNSQRVMLGVVERNEHNMDRKAKVVKVLG